MRVGTITKSINIFNVQLNLTQQAIRYSVSNISWIGLGTHCSISPKSDTKRIVLCEHLKGQHLAVYSRALAVESGLKFCH